MRLPRSTKWFPVIYGFLGIWACAAVFVAGALWASNTKTIHVTRPLISPNASLAQVQANFTGKSYAHGSIPELPGMTCDGWTNGKNGHGWVVLRCSK